MSMKVHCPGCSKPLRVPRSSSGRRARCPSCQKVFVVPKPSDLVEETISTWIEEDVDKLGKEKEKQWEDIGSLKAYQRPQEKRLVPLRPPTQKPAVASNAAVTSATSHDSVGGSSTILAEEELLSVTASASSASILVDEAPSTVPVMPAAPVVPTSSPAAPMPAPVMPAATVSASASAEPETSRRGGLDGKTATYPTSLRCDPNRPHLVVVQCDQAGVVFAFDCTCLENDGFRTSMPVRCAFSGETERRKLFARPMAFIDRSGARIRSPQEIDSKHTSVILPNQTPYDLLAVMGQIADLPKPFCWPVPYYVGPEHSQVWLKCTTKTRDDGGITCIVTLQDGPTALMWLANVNGTCGVEYALLESEVALMQNDAWKQIGDEARRRLNVWCHFEPQEQFRMYLTDGDFGSRDRGLAGLVITDHRLFYCKNFHRGTLELKEKMTIIVRDDKDFAHIAAEGSHGKTKLCKLHQADVSTLMEFLSPWTNISIDRKPMVG